MDDLDKTLTPQYKIAALLIAEVLLRTVDPVYNLNPNTLPISFKIAQEKYDDVKQFAENEECKAAVVCLENILPVLKEMLKTAS